jgi:sialidase-1
MLLSEYVTKIENLHSGLIYRNPTPHLTSCHAYFPSVVQMDNGEMLASFSIGEAFEAVNLNTYISRSVDGKNWSEPSPLLPLELTRQHSNCARLTALPNGEVVAIIVQHDRRDHLSDGLANPENLGFVPTKVLLLRSHDYGHTWDRPEFMIPPLAGSPLELCSPIVPLSDGRWIWPTSTWRNWDGTSTGLKMVAFVSHDQGKTWPEYLDVMYDRAQEKIYWESKIIELKCGALLAVAWVYDEKSHCDLTNHFSISHDGGTTWTPPMNTGLHGQTMAIVELPGGAIFSVYRRMDETGLWGNISQIENNEWINKSTFPLWGADEIHLNGHHNTNIVSQFNELKFGAPCIITLSDGSFYIAFWCYEKLVSNIRWFQLPLSKVLL